MSRNVTIMSCKGYKYVRVCESYRNAEGKPRSKVIENHGRLDQLEAKDPEYVAKLRERVRRENEAAKAAYALNLENAAQSRIRRLESMSQGTADYGFAEPINIGSALLRQIWKEDLNLPQVFRYLLDFPTTLHSSLRICIYFLDFSKNLLHFRVFSFIIECNGCTQ